MSCSYEDYYNKTRESQTRPLPKEGLIRHYMRYVNDTYLTIQGETIDTILQKLNSFDKKLLLIVDTFTNSQEHFPSIIFHKTVHQFILDKISISLPNFLTSHKKKLILG